MSKPRISPKDRQWINRRREKHPDYWSCEITYKNQDGKTSGFGGGGEQEKEKAESTATSQTIGLKILN